MLNKVYCMYDKVSEQYGPPLIGINDNSCRRELKSMVETDIMSHNSAFLSKRSDLVVYQIGDYNTDTGVIDGCVHKQLCTVLELYNEILSEKVVNGDKDGERKE